MRTGAVLARFHSVRELEGTNWDDLLREGDFFVSTSWLSVAEATSDLPFTYLLLRDRAPHQYVGGLVCALVDVKTPLVYSRIDTVLSRLLANRPSASDTEAALASAFMPNLICGGREAGHTRLVLRKASAHIEARRARELIMSAIDVAAGFRAKSVCFLYVDSDDSLLRETLRACGFTEFLHAYRCGLRVDWGDFEGYLHTLSAHRRRRIRQELRRLAAARVEFDLTPLTESLVPALARLELNVIRKHGGLLTRPRLELSLRNQLRYLGKDAMVAIAKREGVICGFINLLRWRDELFAGRVGFDYGLTGKLPIYFGVVFYEAIKYAASHGIRCIDYGIGFYDAKIPRGCQATPVYGYVRAMDPASEAELRRIVDRLEGEIVSDKISS